VRCLISWIIDSGGTLVSLLRTNGTMQVTAEILASVLDFQERTRAKRRRCQSYLSRPALFGDGFPYRSRFGFFAVIHDPVDTFDGGQFGRRRCA